MPQDNAKSYQTEYFTFLENISTPGPIARLPEMSKIFHRRINTGPRYQELQKSIAYTS